MLTQLRRNGLVESRRGGDGGYWLARPSTDICVADVVRAIDGDVIDVRAVPDVSSSTNGLWAATAAGVTSILAGYTIAELVGQASA